LGAGVGYGTWRRWYPALGSRGCEEPHAAFEKGEDKAVFERIRDEEEMMGDGFEMQGRNDGGAYLGTAVR
jgi:diacylglycerol diphosphate phosphatase/phosphatidate phosphatase